MILVQLPYPLAGEDAERQIGQSVDRMVDLAEHRVLQPDHVAGKGEIEKLPAAVDQRAVAEAPPLQHGVEMRRTGLFLQDAGARLDRQLAHLEAQHEGELLLGKLAKILQQPERALRAWYLERYFPVFDGLHDDRHSRSTSSNDAGPPEVDRRGLRGRLQLIMN